MKNKGQTACQEREEVRTMAEKQEKTVILEGDSAYERLDACLKQYGIERPMLVCGASIRGLAVYPYFISMKERIGIQPVWFSDFASNPSYDSAAQGTDVFRREGCDAIIAAGGGSAMDVAKCIKMFSNMDPEINYLEQEIIPGPIPFFAIPTTAGTGSEATKFAVIYEKGEKHSVTHDSCIPSVVVLDASLLATLPLYQRKATMLDALCHGIESYWSIHSTPESIGYAETAIRMILSNYKAYLRNDPSGNEGMLSAAHLAGKAINITQTTAGHAMSYKMVSLYHISHGHAVALCMSELWPYMACHTDRCRDPRGREYLGNVFCNIADAFGCETQEEAIEKFRILVKDDCRMETPSAKEEDFPELIRTVNSDRLKNNPIELDKEAVSSIYHKILSGMRQRGI